MTTRARGGQTVGVAGLPQVVIVGGGFGGLSAARALRKAPVRITLVDRRNHHLFQPLLYQVATAALNPSDIAEPIRKILRRQSNVTVIMGSVDHVDTGARKVVLSDGEEIGYDFLVVAAGATHSYFGHEAWARHAPGLKSIEDALEVRRRVLVAYERAEREPDPGRRLAWLTFAVVGGGPTGLELAGALAEVSRHTLAEDFRNIDPTQARIVLVEAEKRILPTFPDSLSEDAARRLERLGVEVRTGTFVTGIDERGVLLDGERLEARTVLWAAGVSACPLGRSLGAPLDQAGRVEVLEDLTIPGHPEVFVVGDLAAFRQDGKPVPGVAQAAIQGGRQAARTILRALAGRPPEPFRYVEKGMLATIGRAAAVADLGWLKLSGFVAWVIWLVVHIYFLIGFRNRLMVLIQWAWAYLSHDRGARLITGHLHDPAEPGEREPLGAEGPQGRRVGGGRPRGPIAPSP